MKEAHEMPQHIWETYIAARDKLTALDMKPHSKDNDIEATRLTSIIHGTHDNYDKDSCDERYEYGVHEFVKNYGREPWVSEKDYLRSALQEILTISAMHLTQSEMIGKVQKIAKEAIEFTK